MKPWDPSKPPGSDEALNAGCTCPVIDNHYGAGRPTADGVTFVFTLGCPVHDAPYIDPELGYALGPATDSDDRGCQ